MSAGRSHEPTFRQKEARGGGYLVDAAGGIDFVGRHGLVMLPTGDGTGKRTRGGEGVMWGRRAGGEVKCGVGGPRLRKSAEFPTRRPPSTGDNSFLRDREFCGALIVETLVGKVIGPSRFLLWAIDPTRDCNHPVI